MISTTSRGAAPEAAPPLATGECEAGGSQRYYCISHALWLGQNVHAPDDRCVDFLCTLAAWQERLKPHPAQIQHVSLDQNRVCEFLGSIAILCHEQRDDNGTSSTNKATTVVEQCCVSTGPATATMVVFENERHAPFVGWSHKHLLPYERGHLSNETGSARDLCSFKSLDIYCKPLHRLPLRVSFCQTWYKQKMKHLQSRTLSGTEAGQLTTTVKYLQCGNWTTQT